MLPPTLRPESIVSKAWQREPIATLVFTALALVISAASPLAARTTGQLSGLVYDSDGEPLPGVLVAAGSPSQIGGEQTAVTDESGHFIYTQLAPGTYRVRLDLDGFAPQELTEVEVRLERLTEVRATLSSVRFGDEVKVIATTPVIDPEQVSTGHTFTADYIAETSSGWTQLTTSTPGVSPTNFRRVLGSTPQDNTYLLDGMNATHAFQRFPALASFSLPFDAVQEVSLQTSGYEAEYGQASGGVVNVVTKSGGNAFAGTLDARYTDDSFEATGEHHDPDDQASEETDINATLGGPLLKDRLWFFTAAGNWAQLYTPTEAQSTEDREQEIYLARLTWQPGPSWSVALRHSDGPYEAAFLGSSRLVSPEATRRQDDQPSAISSLRVTGVLSPSLFWEGRLGAQTWDEDVLPNSGDLETIGHFNLVTAENYGNYMEQFYAESNETNVEADVTWMPDLGGGSHEIKAGVRYGDPRLTEERCLTGGAGCPRGEDRFRFFDIVGADSAPTAYRMDVWAGAGVNEYGGRLGALYAQDAWRLGPDLTLKLGLRWDQTQWDSGAETLADLSKVQPRIGVAWDMTSDGRNLLRASWGHFMHPGIAAMAAIANEGFQPIEVWLSCSALVTSDPALCSAIAGSIGFGYRPDPEGWDASGWILDPALVFGSNPFQVDDDLKPGYSTEWSVGFERELFRRTSIGLSYINRDQAGLYESTCNGNLPDRTPDSTCDSLVITNLPEARSDYEGFLLTFETRAIDRLHLLASWVVSEARGSMSVNSGFNDDFDVYPYHFDNRYGYLPDHSRHRLKLNGFLRLPLDFTLATHAFWDSEMRWTPVTATYPGMPYGLYALEPRGNRSANPQSRVDLQVAKGFRIGPTRLQLIATVLNIFDEERPTLICEFENGCSDVEMGEGLEYQLPRRYEAGVRVTF